MGNVIGLIRDSHLLLEHGSHGRAQALGVLAAEELGKAWMLYAAAEQSWAESVQTVAVPDDFEEQARRHPSKLSSAAAYGQGGSTLWADWFREPDAPASENELVELARAYNKKKQAGFYVDRRSERVNSPDSIGPDGVAEFLAEIAKSTSMLLVEDHVRMQNSGEEPSWMDEIWEPLLAFDSGNFTKRAAILRQTQGE